MYEPGTQVEVRYPRSKQEEKGNRAAWPWLPGTVEEVCGPDEWSIVVEADEVAVLEGADLYYPMCLRDRSEIREVPGNAWEV